MEEISENQKIIGRSRSSPPLIKLLSMFGLEKYAVNLNKIGYSKDISRLSDLDSRQIVHLYSLIGLSVKEMIKFNEMLNLIKILKQSLPKDRKKSLDLSKIPQPKHRNMSTERQEMPFQEILISDLEKLNTNIVNKKPKMLEKNQIILQIEEAKRKIEVMAIQLKFQKQNIASEIKGDKELAVKVEELKQEAGFSYDSSKLRSTLAHIDVEEMCRCLSNALLKLIDHSKVIKNFRDGLSRDSTKLLPSFETGLDQEGPEDTGLKIQTEITEMFDKEFEDQTLMSSQSLDETDIYNFCKNVIMRARMEKECSIICLIYIERLIKRTGLYINLRN